MTDSDELPLRWKIWDFLTLVLFRRAQGYHNHIIHPGMWPLIFTDKDNFQVIAKRGKECFPSKVATDSLLAWKDMI